MSRLGIALRFSSSCLFAAMLISTCGVAQTSPGHATTTASISCTAQNTITADVVALNQPFMLNRLGAAMPQGMVFALKSDVIALPTSPTSQPGPGNAVIRQDKRPRPIVLRVNQGQCLKINFTNWLIPLPTAGDCTSDKSEISSLSPCTKEASVHVNGMELATNVSDDGSWVGANPAGPGSIGSLVKPGNSATYTLLATQEGTYLLHSMGATFGGSNNGSGQVTAGLFGAVIVEPANAEYYRSQVAQADLAQATIGTLPDGHPKLNYLAKFSSGPRAGQYILKMVDDNNNLTYTDLTAIITGPHQGPFPANEFDPIPASPGRNQPFREFTIHYHEMFQAIQAFTQFYPINAGLGGTLSTGQDNLGINYGTGGIGAEVVANRLGVGASADCVDCRFEEFFLSSWALGDPAMVVDIPANRPDNQPSNSPPSPNLLSNFESQFTQWVVGGGTPPAAPLAAPKATLAYFPDDPSNVYHSYIEDHVKFRVLNVGAFLTHVHHQHAHQWLHTPNDPNSSYLDSQMISPGAAFTLEIDYNGSGNRNQTAGDSIFHCHFYPHFAAGMWSLWRVHDVFEAGTVLDSNGRPVTGARALPDGEIATGTPIPAVVPLPTLAMAPLPEKVAIVAATIPGGKQIGYQAQVLGPGNPGYPFFVPGIAGHRAPHPPLDLAYLKDSYGNKQYLDGGLPRHVVLSGHISNNQFNVWDFSKDTDTLMAQQLPEAGTAVEQAAMAYFGTRQHASFTPDGNQANFIVNGLPRKAPGQAENQWGSQQGAPFADPGVDDNGNAVGNVRQYRGANIQTDVVFSKTGTHYPQERFITLWDDVLPTMSGARMPQPFFFRANSGDIVEYWQTNLVPNYYQLDDYQVQTPTDILGQHIHLVKFDVLASDGAANGFNYEDGTFSPQEVQERIKALQTAGGKWFPLPGQPTTLTAQPPPTEICPDSTKSPCNQWFGAQTTVQRWYADPLDGCPWPPCLNDGKGQDRTIRTVFTHDHFGPSTHQQAGLYAGLLVEPPDATWQNSETGQTMGGYKVNPVRPDGGPTDWKANVTNGTGGQDSYREFALEFGDLALAYSASSLPASVCYPLSTQSPLSGCKPYSGSYPTPGTGTPWGWADPGQAVGPSTCGKPKTSPPAPPYACLITGSQSVGTATVNYRSEPLTTRVSSGTTWTGSGPCTPPTCPANSTDLSYAFASIPRATPALNSQPTAGTSIGSAGFEFPIPFTGAQGPDPYTPLLRAYQNDRVQLRVLVGGYLMNHNFSIHGVKWLFEPSAENSGYRDNQAMGISEHFEMQFTMPVSASNSSPGVLLPASDYLYMTGSGVDDLANGHWGLMRAYNASGSQPLADLVPLANNPSGGITPPQSSQSCPANAPQRQYYVAAISPSTTAVTYNQGEAGQKPIQITTPLLYVLADNQGNPLTQAPAAPLVLRAAAGECINVTLYNRFQVPATGGIFNSPDQNSPINNLTVNLYPSPNVGLHPQLVGYDVTKDSGLNVGFNPPQTVAPGAHTPYSWYAGTLTTGANGQVTGTPVELGSVNLLSSDPMEQQPYALIGSLIIEPQNSIWCEAGSSTCSNGNSPPTSLGIPDTTVDVKDSAGSLLFREFVTMIQDNVYLNNGAYFQSVNFGTEPMLYRYNVSNVNFNFLDVSQGFANSLNVADPQTPIFCAQAGTPVRFRMLHPDGQGQFPDSVWTLHGHVWPEEPYVSTNGIPSAAIGDNQDSQWMGARDGFGPQNHFDLVLASAGGSNTVPGDYLYESFPSPEGPAGIWGIFRVTPSATGASCPTAVRQLFAAEGLLASQRVAAVQKASQRPSPPDNSDRFLVRRGTREKQ
jgi:manganese oxidase